MIFNSYVQSKSHNDIDMSDQPPRVNNSNVTTDVLDITVEAAAETEEERVQRIKLQFAKHDRNRDGKLTAGEFRDVFLAMSHGMYPELRKVPVVEAEAQFEVHTAPYGMDINGFIKAIEVLREIGKSFQSAIPRRSPPPTYNEARIESLLQSTIRGTPAKMKATAGRTLRGVAQWLGVDDDQNMQGWRDAHVSTSGKESRVNTAFGL